MFGRKRREQQRHSVAVVRQEKAALCERPQIFHTCDPRKRGRVIDPKCPVCR